MAPDLFPTGIAATILAIVSRLVEALLRRSPDQTHASSSAISHRQIIRLDDRVRDLELWAIKQDSGFQATRWETFIRHQQEEESR